MGTDMIRLCIYLFIAFALFNSHKASTGVFGIILKSEDRFILHDIDADILPDAKSTTAAKTAGFSLSPMEALDMVKNRFFYDFEKLIAEEADSYCYKMPHANLYLAYEGYGGTEDEYLIHLYEFAEDDPESGIGHSYTYAWYIVSKNTGSIKAYEP